MASGRTASRFERALLQCCAPLDDGVVEQFEHQAKSRQFLFLDGVVIVTFKRFTGRVPAATCTTSCTNWTVSPAALYRLGKAGATPLRMPAG